MGIVKKLAVLAIHGMGTPAPDFAAPAIEELSERLVGLDKNPDEVAWQPIYWADLLQQRQDAFLDAARAAHRLDFVGLREFVVKSLGDAAAYQYTEGPSATYATVHDRIRGLIRQLFENELESQPAPLIVLAHSLGSHIVSSYIWDTQRGKATGADPGASEFERMEWLAGVVTFGSTIPLFTFAHDPVEAIRFPGSALPSGTPTRWVNYFDRDDILGYPLKPISPSYDAAVDADIQINVGSLTTSATPASHGGYWTDNDFTKPVAGLLAAHL